MSDRMGTLLYIPHENSNVRSIRFSRRIALGLSTIGVGVLALLVGTLVATLLEGAGRPDAATENARLRRELTAMEGQVASLGQRMESLLDREEELRLVADLPPVPLEVQSIGVGGPVHPLLLEEESADRLGGVFDDRVESVSTSLDRLLERSELVATSMDDVRKAIVAKNERFEALPSIWPASGFLSSTFSHHRRHPIFHDVRPHYGIDISSRRGNPIVATASGRVARAGWENGHGNYVVLDHGHGLKTTYSHASRILVRTGDKIDRGDAIALVGSTGFSVAPHVHYEVHEDGRPVNPLKYIFPDAIAD